jgi:lipoyl(octanoyl) transferase
VNETAQDAIGWAISPGLTPYDPAVAFMEARAASIAEGQASELIWLLEHPPLYTAGVSAKPGDLRDAARFPVFKTGRGGQFTYHGPGQRVVYVMLDLKKRGRDVSRFVADLERWVIAALAEFNVRAHLRPGLIGVWVDRPPEKAGSNALECADKIAAIGVRLRRWISYHGIALNVEPDLEHFSGITPCGVSDPLLGVTSLVDLGLPVTMADADHALRAGFETVFDTTVSVSPPELGV